MSRKITIDPITRLEGHGKIHIFTDPEGQVKRSYLQVPDFKGFEKFCQGRAVEEMPTLTQKICGVCPTAHHTASSKALDALFRTDPPPAAKKIRELMYAAFVFEDHLLHLFVLGGPDFLVGLSAPKEKRNLFGVIEAVGTELGKKILEIRRRVRGLNGLISGSPLYPVSGLPGGVSRGVSEEERTEIRQVAQDALECTKHLMGVFENGLLKKREFLKLLHSQVLHLPTYYMGTVDDAGKVNFYDGKIRVVDPTGKKHAEFVVEDYGRHLEERVEPWTYVKTLYLKQVGWKGFVTGPESGVYRVGPLARLNASEGMATSLAHAEYERMYDAMTERPAHHLMAYHWARLVELLYAAERMCELAGDEELTSPEVRNLPRGEPGEGVGHCEAPRGTLIHDYRSNPQGIATKVNLLVATQNNAAAISLSVEKAASAVARSARKVEENLNEVEAAFRAYDPCLACATH